MSELSIPIRLVSLRNQKGATQDFVAEACDISRVTLARYENGTRIPRIEIAAKLASFYGCSVDYILGHDLDVDSQEGQQKIRTNDDVPTWPEIEVILRGLSSEKQEEAYRYIKFLEQESNK